MADVAWARLRPWTGALRSNGITLALTFQIGSE